MSKAKITKLKEGAILGNGSKDTVFPVTVADAVAINVKDEDSNFGKNLNQALSYLQDTKVALLDMVKDEEDNFHILAFESTAWYRNWVNSGKDSRYVKYDLNIGKPCTCEPGEEPEEPDIPDPHILNPILLSPIDYNIDPQHTIYHEDDDILIKGQDLTGGIYIAVNDVSSGISFRYGNTGYKGLLLASDTVITDVCSNEGLRLPIYKDISVQHATTTITISSVTSEFESVTIKVEVGEPSRIVIQDEDKIFAFRRPGGMTTTLDNNEYRTRRFKVQGVGIVDDTTIALRDEYGLYIDYNTTGEFPQTGQNLTRFTVDADTLNRGIWVYITCLKYNGYAHTINRVSNCDTVLTISNSTANITHTLGVLFRFLTTPVTPDIIGPGTDEYILPELTLTSADAVTGESGTETQTTINQGGNLWINTGISYHKSIWECIVYFWVSGENIVNDVNIAIRKNNENKNFNVQIIQYLIVDSVEAITDDNVFVGDSETLTPSELNGKTKLIGIRLAGSLSIGSTVNNTVCRYDILLSTEGPDIRGKHDVISKEVCLYATINNENPGSGNITPVETAPGVTFEDNEPLDENISAIIRNTTNYNVDSNYIANSTSIITELPNQFMKNVKQSLQNSVVFDHLSELDRLVNLTTIGNNAFSNCTNLQTVVIPYTVETIGAHAFENDTALTSVTFEDTQEHPSRLKTIGLQAFADCTSLTNVILPQSLTTIRYGAFWRTGLTSVVIPNSVTDIGSAIFAGCPNLEVVDFGEGVTYFADSMLTASPSITDVYFRANQVVNLMRPTGGRPNVVLPTDDHLVTVHVPEDLISDYEESSWAGLSETNIEFVAIEDETPEETSEPEV